MMMCNVCDGDYQKCGGLHDAATLARYHAKMKQPEVAAEAPVAAPVEVKPAPMEEVKPAAIEEPAAPAEIVQAVVEPVAPVVSESPRKKSK